MALAAALRRLAPVTLGAFPRRTTAVTLSCGSRLAGLRRLSAGTQPLRFLAKPPQARVVDLIISDRSTQAVFEWVEVSVIGFKSKGLARLLKDSGSDNKVTIHFINRDGEKVTVKGSSGDTLLDVVINEDLDFDGFGACEGTLACSTCHLIFDEEVYKKLGRVTDEEMDMLDLAYGLTETSRLGCQICLTKSLEGMVARVPEGVTDIRQSKDETA